MIGPIYACQPDRVRSAVEAIGAGSKSIQTGEDVPASRCTGAVRPISYHRWAMRHGQHGFHARSHDGPGNRRYRDELTLRDESVLGSGDPIRDPDCVQSGLRLFQAQMPHLRHLLSCGHDSHSTLGMWPTPGVVGHPDVFHSPRTLEVWRCPQPGVLGHPQAHTQCGHGLGLRRTRLPGCGRKPTRQQRPASAMNPGQTSPGWGIIAATLAAVRVPIPALWRRHGRCQCVVTSLFIPWHNTARAGIMCVGRHTR